MITQEYLKSKASFVYDFVDRKEEKILFFYGEKECFEFYQNKQKTMKYNNKFIKVSKKEYNILLNICINSLKINQEKLLKKIQYL